MRKQTKVAVVVSAAALLAMGASMTSFAKGWTLEDNEWVYLDSYGDRVTDEWKKSVDGNYYYLDEEGVMATDCLIGAGDAETDTYYVKADGTRVVNGWVSVDLEEITDVNGVEVDSVWYYFGSNGKAIKPAAGSDIKKKEIDGHDYFFDAEGRMMSGRVDYKGGAEVYYCGTEDQGWAYEGWQYLETELMEAEDPNYEDEEWFYFKGSGMVKAGEGEEFKASYIDKKWYRFDANGVMATDWQDAGVATNFNGVASYGDVQNYSDGNGSLSDGWTKITKDDESNWYYMVTVRTGDNKYQGVPFNYGGDYYRAKSIGNKIYLFDKEGKMVTGLKELKATDLPNPAVEKSEWYDGVVGKELVPGTYYFLEDGTYEGARQTGKVTITKDDMENEYYFDTKNGAAIKNGFVGNRLYDEDGCMIKAEDGNSKAIVPIAEDIHEYDKDGTKGDLYIKGGSEVIVSSSGAIIKSKTKVDDVYYNTTIAADKTWTVE